MATREALISNWSAELETIHAQAAAANAAGRTEEARSLLPRMKELRASLDAERDLMAVEASLRNIPAPPASTDRSGAWGEIRRAMVEKRAISANGTGVNTVSDVVKALVDGGKLRSKVSVFSAPNAKSIVPCFVPGLALPTGQAPGATGVAADAIAVLGAKELALKSWMSILGVAMDALISTEIEQQLPQIFADAFAGAVDKGIIAGTGAGNDMLGVFVASASGVPVASDINCAAAGAPKWADLLGLAGQIIGLGGNLARAAIVLNPTFVSNLLAEATTSAEGLKMELLTRGTIRSIPVVESSYAPSATVAGSYVAVGGYFDHYGLAIARELTIDPIKVVGSDSTTFQAFAYMQGAPLVGASFRRLKTV
jgi:HK97 family phage major capsid protein